MCVCVVCPTGGLFVGDGLLQVDSGMTVVAGGLRIHDGTTVVSGGLVISDTGFVVDTLSSSQTGLTINAENIVFQNAILDVASSERCLRVLPPV